MAITVTGLKPNHFYNIRVVAVGPNNFQAGSPVIRLRTYGKDGKPQLGNSRLPSSFASNDHPRVKSDDDNDEFDTLKPAVPSVEAAPVLDGSAVIAGDVSSSIPGTRRNTINRRHSPSVASMDQPQIKSSLTDGPELSLDELNRKFEGIRKEIDDTLSLCAKDETEFQQQEDELKKEKDRKRQGLKEKEEQTTQLKGLVRSTMEQMRSVEKERTKKEQQLREKETKKTKVRDNINKLESEIERMQKERDGYDAQKTDLEKNRDISVRTLDESNVEVQEKCAELEGELKEKGKQLQDLKAARESLPAEDEERQRREDELRAQREWAIKRDDLNGRLIAESRRTTQLDAYLNELGEQLLHQQSELAFYNQADPSSLDYDHDPSVPTQVKRHSQNNNSLSNMDLSSPPSRFAIPEGNFPSGSALGRSGFGGGLFMEIPPDTTDETQSESDFRAGGGPLSPTAHSLLPSGIFDETFEVSDTKIQDDPLLPAAITASEDEPRSPASSRRNSNSLGIMSSPRDSSQNLPFPQYLEEDAQSLRIDSSPPPPASSHRLASLLSNFQRSKTSKVSEEGGPPIGSLRLGQSQSFPRGTDDHEMLANKRRRSFSWMKPLGEGARASPTSSSRPFSTRLRFPFANSVGALASDQEPASSRPASISSSDLPRPSTDSGSIWGAPDFSAVAKSRLWSPNEGRWASRNGSRRPSVHGSPSALETTLASADDEILDDDDLLDPQTSPSQVGVIGSRPPGHRQSISQRLNPAAPTFMASLFGSKDKVKEGSEREKSKSKERERHRDKSRESRGKGREVITPLTEAPHGLDQSPTDSRVSRDTFSVHTQPSVSESHESLNLDLTTSNSTSDLNPPSHKDPENVVKKLFRKGSSSKFSLSSRLGKDSSLFKKGPGSATYSDKNLSAEHRSSVGDLDDLGEDVSQYGRSYDSVTSSPSLGPSVSRGKDPKEGRLSTWRFSMKKKDKDAHVKEKKSLDIDRAAADEE